jgi:hypothetical protein
MPRLDYPLVCQRLNKWRLLHLLALARVTLVTPTAAKLYARAICGPDLRVECKRIRSSWAWRTKNLITLSLKGDKVQLASVLHECAHILNYRKGRLADGVHGEAFTRTYARLLREVLE